MRTRAYFPQWGTLLRIRYARPDIAKTTLLALLNNAGILIGVGDNRQEKFKGNFGTFRTCNDVEEIAHLRGKASQQRAVEEPVPDTSARGHGDAARGLRRGGAEESVSLSCQRWAMASRV